MGEIFQRSGSSLYGKAFVTITNTYITPDLLVSRFYLSIFNVDDKEAVLDQIKANTPDLRRVIGTKLRHNLRRIPELEFFHDDSLDNVMRLEEIFKKDKKNDPKDDTSDTSA